MHAWIFNKLAEAVAKTAAHVVTGSFVASPTNLESEKLRALLSRLPKRVKCQQIKIVCQ
jgi:hypothetical protein